MELTSQKREVKLHGTYGFPVYVGRKLISAYPTGSFPWHWHDELEVLVVESGTARAAANGRDCTVKQGEGFLVNAGVLHSI